MLWRGLAGAVRTSAARARKSASAGRVELRLRVPRHLASWWRGLEAQARRWLPPGMSWVRFLCLSLWEAWRHVLGGGEEAENLASVCTWCHLFGIHGGRIRAEGTAENIRWEIGPASAPPWWYTGGK